MTITTRETDSPFAHTCGGCGKKFLPREYEINPFDETEAWHALCGIEAQVENHYQNQEPKGLRKWGRAIDSFLTRNGSRLACFIMGNFVAFSAGYWLIKLSQII